MLQLSSHPVVVGGFCTSWKGRSCCHRLGVGVCCPVLLSVLLWVLKPVNRWHRVVTCLFGGAGTGVGLAELCSPEVWSVAAVESLDTEMSPGATETGRHNPKCPPRSQQCWHQSGLGMGHCSQQMCGTGRAHHQCQDISPCCYSPCTVPDPQLFIVLVCVEQQHP